MISDKKKKFKRVVNSNEKGFSLVELIVVIVIAGIITAVAIPKLNNVSDVDIYATARQVKSDIRFAQQLAMGRFMSTDIVFTPNADTYTITRGDPPVETFNRQLPPSSNAAFNAVGGGSTALAYTFNSSGIPVDAGGVPIDSGLALGGIVELEARGVTAQVQVEDMTGRATIQ